MSMGDLLRNLHQTNSGLIVLSVIVLPAIGHNDRVHEGKEFMNPRLPTLSWIVFAFITEEEVKVTRVPIVTARPGEREQINSYNPRMKSPRRKEMTVMVMV